MLTPVYSKKFPKSISRCVKRGYDFTLFWLITEILYEEKLLPPHCRPHKLIGNYAGFWECHIKFDWLLIYRYNYDNNEIIFEDTRTHSDLF